MAGRTSWAGLHLLDRQLIDRDGRMAGCVDDLELESSDDTGQLYVTAIISGPGALAQRMGRRRFGTWMRWVHAIVSTGDGDPSRIPFNLVSDIGSHITIAADHGDVGSGSAERWVRDHIIDRLPGSSHAPE